MLPSSFNPSPDRPRPLRLAWLTGRLLLGAGLCGLVSLASAQTPWERLSQALAAKNNARKDAQTITGRNLEAQGMLNGPAAQPVAPPPGEVPDEQAAAQNAALNTDSLGATTETLAPDAPAARTGLATNKGSSSVNIDLGRESDESENALAINLFQNQDILRLLGDQPRFVYDPGDRRDPMLVPWVHRAAIFKELTAMAQEAMAKGSFQAAIDIYQRILALNDPRYTAEAQARLSEIVTKENAATQAAVAAAAPPPVKIELPAWVHDNTTGVIYSPGAEICLVGEYMLHVGDPLPNYPEVKVCAITDKKVTYQIQDKTFEVAITQEQP